MTGEFMWGFDGWVYCCHGFANTRPSRARAAPSDHHALGQHLPHQARRLADRAVHARARSTRSAWPSIRSATSTRRLPHAGRIYQLLQGRPLSELRQAARRPRLRPGDDHARPRLDRHRRHRLLRRRPVSRRSIRDNLFIGNVVTNRINRDRLERHGSTFKGIEMPDFVKCDDP